MKWFYFSDDGLLTYLGEFDSFDECDDFVSSNNIDNYIYIINEEELKSAFSYAKDFINFGE